MVANVHVQTAQDGFFFFLYFLYFLFIERLDPNWFGLCCLLTPGLSEDIQCHV